MHTIPGRHKMLKRAQRETTRKSNKGKTQRRDSRRLLSEKESQCRLEFGCTWEHTVSCHVRHVTYQQDAVSQWLLGAGVTLPHTDTQTHTILKTALADNKANNGEFQQSSAKVNKICITLITGGFVLSLVDMVGPSLNGLLELNHTWQPSQSLMFIHEEFPGFLFPGTEQLIKSFCFSSPSTQKGNNITEYVNEKITKFFSLAAQCTVFVVQEC